MQGLYIALNIGFVLNCSTLNTVLSSRPLSADFADYTCRKDNVVRLWEYLLELLKARRMRLELSLQLQRVFQEMSYIHGLIEEIKVTNHYFSHTVS
jgi:hypothetical protein